MSGHGTTVRCDEISVRTGGPNTARELIVTLLPTGRPMDVAATVRVDGTHAYTAGRLALLCHRGARTMLRASIVNDPTIPTIAV